MKIAFIGYGKMGKAIEEIALAKGHEIVLRISQNNLNQFTIQNIQQADVCIEFSTPETAFKNITTCLQAGIPVVSGTTAWLDKLKEAESICLQNHTAFLYASNFSIGVNLFFKLNAMLAKLMSTHHEYKVSMEEIHHTQKKDAPSGTAVTLAEGILANQSNKKQWVNEVSSNPEDLIILSKRIDPAPGTHTINYDSDIDSISITHTAHSRKGFASGALMAAEFLVGKQGIYTMKDVLVID
ncbi:MAG: 4-hydroxy-tetrahydrodipicolinate reductase [Bacteroidetes bacterium]|nr:4-hydroxy-tetrahydrodipicolinate reductase [Bacteroidota bacterium]